MFARGLIKLSAVAVLGCLMTIQGAAAASSRAAPDCEVSFAKMRQTVSWHQAQNRIQVVIDQACAASVNLPLRTSGVTVSVETGAQNKLFSRLRAKSGTYMPNLGTLTLRDVASIGGEKKIRAKDLTIDLRTGEIRSTNGFYLDLSERS